MVGERLWSENGDKYLKGGGRVTKFLQTGGPPQCPSREKTLIFLSQKNEVSWLTPKKVNWMREV